MVNTKIKDLDYSHESEFLEDINSQEMTNIHGGYSPRRWSWQRTPRTNPEETITTGIPSIDARINSWQTELQKNYDRLQAGFGF